MVVDLLWSALVVLVAVLVGLFSLLLPPVLGLSDLGRAVVASATPVALLLAAWGLLAAARARGRRRRRADSVVRVARLPEARVCREVSRW